MSPVLILVRKSILNFRRARAAIVITFAVPIVLIYLFGHVFGLYRKDPGPNHISIAVLNESSEPAAKQLVDALRAEKAFFVITEKDGPNHTKQPLTEADIRAALHDNDYRFALILPADLFSDQRVGLHLKFLSNPRNEIEAQTVTGILQKTIFSKVPQLLGQSLQRRARNYIGQERFDRFNHAIAAAVSSTFGGDQEKIQQRIESGDFFDPLSGEKKTSAQGQEEKSPVDAKNQGDGTDIFSRIVNIETEQVAGKETKNPMAARTVGGYAIMFLLFAVSNSAATMFEERDSGVIQRLLSSPVRPAHILWSRFVFGILLGLAQITTMFIAGRIFFGLEIFDHAGALLAVMLSAAAACSGFGILVSAIAPSATAAQGLATFLVISMSAVGGAWFPTSFMPDYIQTISKLTVVYWAVEGLTDVLWAGRSFLEVLPKVGVLSAIAAVVMAFSIWRFSRNKFFE